MNADDEIKIVSAEEQLELEAEEKELGRKICRRWLWACLIMFIFGALIGSVGHKHFSSRVDPLKTEEYTEFGEVLSRMPSGQDACHDFKSFSGDHTLDWRPSFSLQGIAKTFYETALVLPRNHVGKRNWATLDEVFKLGIEINGIWISRDPERPWNIVVQSRNTVNAANAQRLEFSLSCTFVDADGNCRPKPGNSTQELGCTDHIKSIARSMLGCKSTECMPSLVVVDYATVCSAMPLSNDDALDAMVQNDFKIQSEVASFTSDEIAEFAARTWPSLMEFSRPDASAESGVRRVVESVQHAIEDFSGKRTSITDIVIGWPHVIVGPSALPEHVSLGDLVIALTAIKKTMEFDTPELAYASDPFSAHVSFVDETLYVSPVLTSLTPALPAYRTGALAHSIALALAPLVACALDDYTLSANLLARGNFYDVDGAVDDVKLFPSDSMELGATQLFYIGAAATTSDKCRLGYVYDVRFQDSFGCTPVHCYNNCQCNA